MAYQAEDAIPRAYFQDSFILISQSGGYLLRGDPTLCPGAQSPDHPGWFCRLSLLEGNFKKCLRGASSD